MDEYTLQRALTLLASNLQPALDRRVFDTIIALLGSAAPGNSNLLQGNNGLLGLPSVAAKQPRDFDANQESTVVDLSASPAKPQSASAGTKVSTSPIAKLFNKHAAKQPAPQEGGKSASGAKRKLNIGAMLERSQSLQGKGKAQSSTPPSAGAGSAANASSSRPISAEAAMLSSALRGSSTEPRRPGSAAATTPIATAATAAQRSAPTSSFARGAGATLRPPKGAPAATKARTGQAGAQPAKRAPAVSPATSAAAAVAAARGAQRKRKLRDIVNGVVDSDEDNSGDEHGLSSSVARQRFDADAAHRSHESTSGGVVRSGALRRDVVAPGAGGSGLSAAKAGQKKPRLRNPEAQRTSAAAAFAAASNAGAIAACAWCSVIAWRWLWFACSASLAITLEMIHPRNTSMLMTI